MTDPERAPGELPLAQTLHLVHGAQNGDAAVAEELLRRYLPRVRRIVAMRLGKPLRDVRRSEEDLVQETLLSAWRHLDRFDAAHSEASFRSWIATIAVNRIRDALRAEQRQRAEGPQFAEPTAEEEQASELDLPGHEVTPSQHAIRRESERSLESVIKGLPARYRQIVDLRDFVGMSYAEAAEQMGRTVMGCRKLHQRAWEMIRERLE